MGSEGAGRGGTRHKGGRSFEKNVAGCDAARFLFVEMLSCFLICNRFVNEIIMKTELLCNSRPNYL